MLNVAEVLHQVADEMAVARAQAVVFGVSLLQI